MSNPRFPRVSSNKVTRPPDDPLARDNTIYLRHAGLVLAAVYLPHLWSRLGLADAQAFVNDDAAERAAHLLHWLACGHTEAPEQVLVLNKLLCGIELVTPLRAGFEPTNDEREVLDSLLAAMIGQWRSLGGTTSNGLRESFLQRPGALTHDDNGWQLLVKPRSYDMLLDRLPWDFRTVGQPWMKEVLYVQWR